MPLWVFFFVILTLSSSSHCSPPPPLTLRMRRYADAIFTNSYRKVLGQLSARKLLQDIMSRQQGESNQERGARARLGRQVDSMWAEQKQMELESILVALLQKHRGIAGYRTAATPALMEFITHRSSKELDTFLYSQLLHCDEWEEMLGSGDAGTPRDEDSSCDPGYL
nr:somatoliberin [Gorilla gorilla gorilla]